MTNKETLELLKPIMLDGTEKAGDKVFSLVFGCIEIVDIDYEDAFPILTSVRSRFKKDGRVYPDNIFPDLFKTNPFEYLAKLNNNQERVIEVMSGNRWIKRVLIMVKHGRAICWDLEDNILDAKNSMSASAWGQWREVPKSITKEEALKMLAEKGVDTTNLTIE